MNDQEALSQESSFTMTSKESYSKLAGRNSPYSPTVTSSLVNNGDRGAERRYGSGGDDAISITESGDTAESSSPEVDRVPLLSDIIKKKKKGE